MSAGRRDERGVAAVELALLLPMIALVVFAAIPLLERATVNGDLHRAAWEGMRYAVKVRPNPTAGASYACSTPDRITRRHTVEEIVAETRRAAKQLLGDPDAGGPLPGTVVVYVNGTPATGSATCTVPANATVRVEVSLSRPAGAAAAAANNIAAIFGNTDGIFADPYVVTVDAVGVLE